MVISAEDVRYVIDSIYNASGRKIGNVVAKELLTLAGGDCESVINCSIHSGGLDQCKARIINERFELIEELLAQ